MNIHRIDSVIIDDRAKSWAGKCDLSEMDLKIIAVSNRKLCERPFLEQIERVCQMKPQAIILREKDLSE